MKNRFTQNSALILALVCVYFVISCADKRNGPSARGSGATTVADNGGNTSSGGDTKIPQDPQGTSTSGGGTGVADKVWASYIVDPLSLPAYKNHLKAQLANITPDDKEDSGSIEQYFKAKTWYIAPIDLKIMDKEALGVAFMKGSPQQIAVQTRDAVWIDKRVWDRMKTEEDQSDLLRHEWVMSLYLMRFLSFGELCKQSLIAMNGDKGCKVEASLEEWVTKKFKAEPLRKLNETDNENIRFVEGWLAQNTQKPIKESDFINVLAAKNFDHRLFDPKNYDKEGKLSPQPLMLSGEELKTALRGAALAEQMPDQCNGLQTGKKSACKVSFTFEDIQFKQGEMTVPMPGLQIVIEVPGQPPIKNSFQISPDGNELSVSEEDEGQYVYTLHIISAPPKVKMGTHVYSGVLFFSKTPGINKDQLSLDGITLKHGVVVELPKLKKDKEAGSCPTREVHATGLADDSLFIRRLGAKPAPTVEELYNKVPPSTLCNEMNVE